jgi:hypothetical protein
MPHFISIDHMDLKRILFRSVTMPNRLALATAASLLFAGATLDAQIDARMPRYPDVSATRIAFV